MSRARRSTLLDSRGRDKAALVTLDVETARRRCSSESDKADVNDTLAHPATGKVQAAQVEYLRDEWQVVDPAIKGDIEFLNAKRAASGRSRAGRTTTSAGRCRSIA